MPHAYALVAVLDERRCDEGAIPNDADAGETIVSRNPGRPSK
jgi:hypothetical protein